MDYFYQPSPAVPASRNDETFNKIMGRWKGFADSLPAEDRQLLLKTLSECYRKYEKAIKTCGESETELTNGLLMSILVGQQIQADDKIRQSQK